MEYVARATTFTISMFIQAAALLFAIMSHSFYKLRFTRQFGFSIFDYPTWIILTARHGLCLTFAVHSIGNW